MSSFFPKDDVSTLDDRLNAAMNRIIHSATNPCLVEFPDVSKVLWCGEAVDNSFYLNASDCIPKLFLGFQDIHALLGQVQGTNVEVTNTLNSVDVYHASSFEQTHERDSERYFFALPDRNRSFASNSVVSVPLTNDAEMGDSTFDRQSTIALIRNLIKSLQYGKDFSLKSCYRIRAIGHAHNGYSQHNMHDVHGKLTFEAVCPNVCFRATPIRTLPIVPSPLFNELTRANPRQRAPKMGYLTLNQSRKLVPMMENDPSVSTTPLVGVWIRYGHLTSESINDHSSLLKHPFSWGACVRYLCHEAIRDRRFADQETFVVVIIVAGVELEYYEVCRMVDIVEGVQQGGSVGPLALRVEDFLCSELTVDLSTHHGMTGEEYVTAQFRPQSGIVRHRNQRNNQDRIHSTPNESYLSASRHPSSLAVSSSTSSLYESETITPAPRNTLPTPLSLRSPTSPFAAAPTFLRASADLSVRRSSDRLYPPSGQHAEIISAQQRQIDLLTLEVQRLSQLVDKNHSNCSNSAAQATSRVVVDRSIDAPSVLFDQDPSQVDFPVNDVTDAASIASHDQIPTNQESPSVVSSIAPPTTSGVGRRSYPIKEEDSYLSNVSECSELPSHALPSRRPDSMVSHDRLSSFGGRPNDAVASSYSSSSSSRSSAYIRPESDSILAICAKYGKY